MMNSDASTSRPPTRVRWGATSATRFVPYAGAAASGLLLAAADHPIHAWPLVAVSFVPLFYALLRFTPSFRATIVMAFLFGATYTAPVLAHLRFPVVFAVPLGLITTTFWCVTICGARHFARLPPLRSSLAVGALAALVEWACITLVPIWGTAQSFVRSLATTAWAIQVVSLMGVTGLVFLLIFSQMLLAHTLSSRKNCAVHAMILVAGVVGYVAFGLARVRMESQHHLRVAAYGWADSNDVGFAWTRVAPLERVERQYAPAIADASRDGAHLIVFPEVGLFVNSTGRNAVLDRLTNLAQTYRITLDVGHFDRSTNRNESLFIPPNGQALPAYVKTHLIPFVENYEAGSGTLVEVDVHGSRVGTMICQDDNFEDLARQYGQRGTPLVAVPTNDWRDVATVHFENSLFRPVENGYGLVRAAHDGISAIVSQRGTILAARNHFRDGPGMVIADVPLGDGPTVYARWGAFVPLVWLALVLIAMRRIRSPGIAA